MVENALVGKFEQIGIPQTRKFKDSDLQFYMTSFQSFLTNQISDKRVLVSNSGGITLPYGYHEDLLRKVQNK